ncbi:hypothetical protein PEC302107_40230 [Pectobacterium araliae]|uniref:DNA sulfur modification protein DndB n=1 Tax=Pectobacterium TaxID=122277 RepID=UPI002085BEF4|nr:DNA sulfur modification protein DndB [Pectobacterium actinidiae]WEF12533.1 DNA sulfur modification protein DndB [Pectobacterium actinidiae]GKW22294.1 hypothetical protein PEC302107_40230 [Pectobacterium carotovorum subsp. carotovorum]
MHNRNQTNYFYMFPAVRGIQAGREFYIATCPLLTIPKIFSFDEEEVPPELRAQRSLNKARIPDMVRYLLDNPDNYIFSALTASVAVDVHFEALNDSGSLGTLQVPMGAQILINDGQHRRKAIEEALRENPDLGYDNIAVLFFVDRGLTRSQQMFADLNKYAVRPSPSLSTLYDHRDPSAQLACHLAENIEPFIGLTEMEKSSISSLSNKLFTLSSIKQATRALLGKGQKDSYTDREKNQAELFWRAVFMVMPEWQMVRRREISPASMRQEYIHSHGVCLQAIGLLGKGLLQHSPNGWEQYLLEFKNIDWRKANPDWLQRTMQHGKISKSATSIHLTCNALKLKLGIPLNSEEKKLEEQVKL